MEQEMRNHWRELLERMRIDRKIKIVAKNPDDKEIADQFCKIIIYLDKKEINGRKSKERVHSTR